MSTSDYLQPQLIAMNKPYYNFVIIDDDSCHNIICALSIKKAFKPININIVGFTNAMEGIDYIETKTQVQAAKTVLLLDIVMPHLSGWDVVSKIEKMPEAVKNNLIIYMLSACVTKADRQKAFLHPCVKDCIDKPLSDHLLYITEELAEISLNKKIPA